MTVTARTRARPRAGARPAAPIFFDMTGRRWRRIRGWAGLAVVAVAALAAGFATVAARPLWAAPLHQAAGYPAHLVGQGEPGSVPVIGGEGSDALIRVDLVQREAGRVYLADPFSGKVIRAATADEADRIGTSPYALEWYGHPAPRQLVLTFDDGPDPVNTPQILDLLSRERVPATFFVTGQNAVRYPALVNREIAEGHVVGNHTLTHSGLGHGSILDRADVVWDDRIIRATAGYGTRLFRLPYGDPDDNVTAVLRAQQLGYLVVDYDVDTGDWQYAPGDEIPLPALDGRGHVVLMHDGGGDRAATIGLLSELIARAKAAGYTFATAAPLVPAGYQPGPAAPAAADHFARYAAWTALALPAVAIGWLFWAGAGSLAVMSLLYVTLAMVSWLRQRRTQCVRPPPGEIWVTVALPCYNEEKVVAKTLTALARSSYQRFEVIAVDDGSTDGTWGVLTAFASVWPRLRVFRQLPNRGKAAALNLAIAQARGWIVVTLDGDTIFEPQTIGRLARHFTDPRVGVVAGQVKVGNRRNLLTAWQSLEYMSGICVTRMAEGLVGAIAIAPGACAAWRKRAIVEAGGYSAQTLAEDCDLTLSIQRLGYQVRQDIEAVAWTEAPMTLLALARQRLRWTFGNLQAFRKHRGMMLRPRYGVLGMVVLPYALLSVIVPLAFMPLTYIAAGLSIASGRWQSVALFAVFVAGVHLVISIVAVKMVGERLWHLLVVPVYRLIYEPLRGYVLYRSLLMAAKGRAVGWYRPARTGTVLPAVPGDDPGEGVGLLSDAAAPVGRCPRRAGPVAVHRPEREPGELVRPRVAQHGLEVGRRDDLARVGPAVHRGDAHALVGEPGRLAVGAHQVGPERLGGLHGGRGHVRHARGEVERHDRPRVHPQPGRGRPPDQIAPGRVRTGRLGADGDGDPQPRIAVAEQDERVHQALADRGAADLGVLHVQVDGAQPVGGDHLPVGAGQRRGRGACEAELAAAHAAERHGDLAAGRADGADRRAGGAPGQPAAAAVPYRVAAPVGDDERQREAADPGRRHHLGGVPGLGGGRGVVEIEVRCRPRPARGRGRGRGVPAALAGAPGREERDDGGRRARGAAPPDPAPSPQHRSIIGRPAAAGKSRTSGRRESRVRAFPLSQRAARVPVYS